MTPSEEAEGIVQAVAAMKGDDPTPEEIVKILTLAISPIVRGVHALERIATALEKASTNAGALTVRSIP